MLKTEPYLRAIYVYPIKSLDGVSLAQGELLKGGALKSDREFAIVDQQGNFVNGKRNGKVHLLRATFDEKIQQVCLRIQGNECQFKFHLIEDRNDLENWLTNYFGFAVKLVQNQQSGFPDDTNAPGPTIISKATLQTVSAWFPKINIAEMRQRLRANLEIDGVPPFWEDQLFATSGKCVQFKIGEILLEGINPCQRCIVPTRDSQTGAITPNFQKEFSRRRQESLPPWIISERFNHFYRISVNTNVPSSQAGKFLNIGDGVKILGIAKTALS